MKRPAFVILLLIALAFALKMSLDFSRVWVFSSWLVGISLVSTARFCAHYFIRSWAESGHFTRNIVILGAGERRPIQADIVVRVLRRSTQAIVV